MSEPENFLSRWSRRKREAEQEPDTSARRGDPPTHRASADQSESAEALAKAEGGDPELLDEKQSTALDSRLRGNERTADSAGDDASEKEPALDLSTLPSLESIAAETDIRAFLQKGVPAELTRAALRRAWAADPTIRDFIGLAENQWDFATGSDLPGFGPLEANPEELRRMVEALFGEVPGTTSEAEATAERAERAHEVLERPAVPAASQDRQQAESQEVAPATEDQPGPESAQAESSASIVHHNEVNIAMQQNSSDEEYKPAPIRRSHGRALPQ